MINYDLTQIKALFFDVERRSVSELLSDLMLQYRDQQKSALSEYEKVRK